MINFAVVGIGNFGAAHLDAARHLADAGLAHFTAVADIRLADFADDVAELRGRGVACYDNHRELLDQHPELDLITLPMPINLHAPMTIECLERGLNVLVEKPPAATLADARQMAETARRTGKMCAVGFQYSTSPLLAAIRGLVEGGRLGEITSLSTLCLGKRYDNYYNRAKWSGRISVDGTIVRDGTLNNPYAHMAQLLLTVAGIAAGETVRPVALEAELYAGHDIETEDTCSLRARLSNGVPFHFISSVCTHLPFNMQTRIEGTKGTVIWDNYAKPQGRVRFNDGTEENLPDLITDDGGNTRAVFRNVIAALEGREPLACPIDHTLAFAELVDKMFSENTVTHLYGTPHVERMELEDGGRQEMATFLEGIEDYAAKAYENGKLYSEVGAPWAKVKV
ncbi:MAG: Gfo/Idh/MocA family protein [Armatimonadota bacterium]